MKKKKIKQQKIIIFLLGIAILLSFSIIMKATITGLTSGVSHSWENIILPATGETTSSGIAAAIWPSLNAEFLEGKSLTEITEMSAGGGANCLWFFTGTCPSGWEARSSVNYKCSSTTYNPPGATCDNSYHTANLCCSTGTLTESCDGVDNDFDGTIDNGCDDDNDNYCDSFMVIIGIPPTCTNGGGDCDDNNPIANPGGTETRCNNVDENCNNWKADVDCDGYCIIGNLDTREDSTSINCPSNYHFGESSYGFVDPTKEDCNDNDADAYPGHPQEPQGDTVDRNCDGMTWHLETGDFEFTGNDAKKNGYYVRSTEGNYCGSAEISASHFCAEKGFSFPNRDLSWCTSERTCTGGAYPLTVAYYSYYYNEWTTYEYTSINVCYYTKIVCYGTGWRYY